MNDQTPCVETQMLIRKPCQEVFQAFQNPEITRNFWFTKGSDKLVEGAEVVWEWEMYQLSTNVKVLKVQRGEIISIEWGTPVTRVDFVFQPIGNDTTYVVIKSWGFKEKGEELLKILMDNTGGFTTVLDGLKCYLEHGINLNLIADKFPKGK